MSRSRSLTIPALLALAALFTSAPARAQDPERVWEQGTVWTVSYIETKPGMFNPYIKDLSNVWRRFLEEQEQAGEVVSYKLLSVFNPRDSEPDLLLLVEYKNMAVFDSGPEVFEERAKRILGSMEKTQEAAIDRGKLRTLRGSLLAREIRFKK